jgi:hypothetical protein
VAALQAEVGRKEEELRRGAAQAASREQSLHKAVERLQRENAAGSAEIERLAQGDGGLGATAGGGGKLLMPLPVDSYQVGGGQPTQVLANWSVMSANDGGFVHQAYVFIAAGCLAMPN